MDKQDFIVISTLTSIISILASVLVIWVPASGQIITLMLTLPALMMMGAWAIIRKVDGE
jgi:hypothetical protein